MSLHLTPTSCGRQTFATRGIRCLLTDQHTGEDFRRHRRVVTPRDKDTANSVEYLKDSRSLGYTNGDPTQSSNSEEPIRWTADLGDNGDINQEGVVGDSAMVSVPSAATAKYAGLLTEDSTTLRDDSIPNKNADR
jgi:hypothetical protein